MKATVGGLPRLSFTSGEPAAWSLFNFTALGTSSWFLRGIQQRWITGWWFFVTPLKNDGVRQLGWLDIPNIFMGKCQIHGNQLPPTVESYVLMDQNSRLVIWFAGGHFASILLRNPKPWAQGFSQQLAIFDIRQYIPAMWWWKYPMRFPWHTNETLIYVCILSHYPQVI